MRTNIAKFFSVLTGGWFDKRLWSSIGGSRKTVSHEMVSEDSALNYSAVWCATRLMCGTAASLPLPLFSGRDKDERFKERKHPVYRLLNGAPNQEQTAYNFRSVMWQWQINWGNAYAEIVREGNNPEAPVVALFPLHPRRVKLRRDEFESLYYEVDNEETREKTELMPWQMLHIPSIITTDGLYGHGVIEHARESIGAGIAAEKYGANWFGGAAVPRVVIEHAANWNPDQRKAFREEWEEIHSGAAGSRVAILQGGAQVKPLSLSAEDSQFLQTREFGVAEIARWYGIPPHLLQHLVQSTYNNVEQLGISFVQYSLIPWLRIWEQCIWQKLLTPREQESYFAEHNVDALLRGDTAARASFYQQMTSAAIMTRNQCRQLENMDPVDGGDTFLVQGAMVPLDEDGKPESDFVNGSSTPTVDTQTTSDREDPPPDTQQIDELNSAAESVSADVRTLFTQLANARSSAERAVIRRLNWAMTKEAVAIIDYAKNPAAFSARVEAFYTEHERQLTEEFSELCAALSNCGRPIAASEMVSRWVAEGKRASLVACERTENTKDVQTSVKRLTESPDWRNRPLRALMESEHATLVV